MTNPSPIRSLLDRIDENWPEAASVEADVIFGLIRAHEILRKFTDQALAGFELSPAAFEILVALRASPPPHRLTPTELYQTALLSSGGTTKVLIGLEKRGWTERIPNPEDGRSRLVQLTETGRAQTEAVMRSVMIQDRQCLVGLADEQLLSMSQQVLELAAHMERRAAETDRT